MATSLLVGDMRVKPFLRAANLSWDPALWKRRHLFVAGMQVSEETIRVVYDQTNWDAGSYRGFIPGWTTDRCCAGVGTAARHPAACPGPSGPAISEYERREGR